MCVYVYMFVCMCVCVYVYMVVCMCVHIHTYIRNYYNLNLRMHKIVLDLQSFKKT